MTREEVISGLQMTMDLYLFDPATGEILTPDMLNDTDRVTYDACKGAIEALKAQIDKDTNVPSNDTISRQAATDIVLFECGEFVGLAKTIIKRFEELPSAQSEKRTEERTETHACDCISRRAAINAMCSACGYDCDKSKFVYDAPQDEQVILCPEHYVLSTLPSAQPEITDEQAVEHLQASGWMQNHDKQMYEMGLRERKDR